MAPEPPSELTVAPESAGRRLDAFLAGPVGSRAVAQGLIEAGLVLVDGRPARKRHLVAPGEVVQVRRPAPEPSDGAPEARFDVVFEDAHLLVIDKPPGIVVHRGHRSGTLAQALAARGAAGGEVGRPGIVHRLDRDTSGLLVVAKSDEVHRALKDLIASRELRREYLALVDGHPTARTGTIDAPIGRDRHDRVLVSLDSEVAREARTHFSVVRLLPHSTLLEVHLDTGRTHQIRVHLAAIGHPVCGDPQYGVVGRYGLRRQFLHAQRLAFTHPVTGRGLDLRSPLPADLAAALTRAQGAGDQPGS
jgi:23S rRNA pseudouridine1911/1915/1917 synthase